MKSKKQRSCAANPLHRHASAAERASGNGEGGACVCRNHQTSGPGFRNWTAAQSSSLRNVPDLSRSLAPLQRRILRLWIGALIRLFRSLRACWLKPRPFGEISLR